MPSIQYMIYGTTFNANNPYLTFANDANRYVWDTTENYSSIPSPFF